MPITVNFSYFLSNAKCIYTFVLNSSDSSVSVSSSGSIFDVFKDIDMKAFPKSIGGIIRSIIIMLYSAFIILAFF